MSPLEISVGIPDGLAAVIQRALALNPRQRFASAAEMREALLPFTNH